MVDFVLVFSVGGRGGLFDVMMALFSKARVFLLRVFLEMDVNAISFDPTWKRYK